MTKKVKPTLYIALGNAAATIVQKNKKLMEERFPVLANICTDVCISESGACHSVFKDEQFFKFQFESDIHKSGVFSENFKELLEKENKLYDRFRMAISNINTYERRKPLIEQDYEIGEPQIVLFSSFHEAVGSALISPILKQIYSIKQEVNYLYSEVTGIFVLPDLFHGIDDQGSLKLDIDYNKNEKVSPMVKDSPRQGNNDIRYSPISNTGKTGVLFLKGADSPEKIDIRDIDQGSLGSCYFLALLGGIARTQPAFIEQMVADNLDGTYTVRFYKPDGSEKHITVDNKFWLDKNKTPIYSNVSNQTDKEIETWVMLIEKAWAKMHGGYDHIDGSNPKKERYDVAITGNQRVYLDLGESDGETFLNKIYQHFHEKKQPVVFSSKAAIEEGDDPDLVSNHAYILKDISLQNLSVNLYNPHGYDHYYNENWDFVKQHFTGATLYNVKPHEKAISGEYKLVRDIEYSRSLASLTELDSVLNKTEEKGQSLLNYAFIVGNKNRNNITLGAFDEMLVSLSEFSLLIINDGFANTKLSIQLGDDRDGKSNRYSSIGYSTLLFPEQTVVTSLKEMGKKDILGELQNSFRNQKFDAATVGSEVNAFLSEHKFHQFKDRLQIEEEGGKAIYEDFKFQGNRNQDTPLNDFLNSLEDQEKEYESKVFHKNIVPKIEGRQKKLVEDLHNKIQSKIDTEIDRSSRGINFAHAFSSVLVREDCDAITGQIIDEVSDLKSIEKSVLEFYRNQSDLPQLIEENKDLHKLYRNKERQFKKLSNDIQNLEEKVSVAQDSAVDASTLQTELNSKKQEWSKLEGELSTMRGEYENGKGKIESLKRELEHPEYRTRLREDDLANHQTKIQEHISILKNHEEKRNQHLDYLTELNKKKDKIFKKLLIWRPLMIFGIPILGFGLLEIFESEIMTSIAQMAESSRLEIYVELFLIALIAYGIWAFLHYRKNIGKELKQANIDLNALNKEKLDLYNEHVKLKGEIYRKRYDHIANASAYQGIHDLIELTEDNKKKLGNYKNEIYGIVGNAEEKIDGLHFDNNLFQSSVPEKEQIKHLKEDLSLQRFLSDKDGRTLNAYYTDYSQSGSTKKIEGDLDEYLTDMYRSLGNRTVMDYIYGRDQKIKENLNSSTRFKLLKEASEVYINLKDYGVGDQTEESAHFYTSNLEHPDADKSQQQLIASGLPTHSKYSTGDKNSVSLFRALKGFPAFQITLMDECRTIMDDLVKNNPDWKRSDFFIDPQYANESLFPSSLILGNASDEIRIAFAQGRALGIIEDGTKPFCFENVDLGNSIDECIKFLRSLKGEPIKDRLMKLIEQKLNGIKTSDQGKAVMHSVNDFLTAHPELDAVDKKILDTLMRSLV